MRIAIFVMNIFTYVYAARIRGRLLFPLAHDSCGVYLRPATIRSAAFIRGNMVCVHERMEYISVVNSIHILSLVPQTLLLRNKVW